MGKINVYLPRPLEEAVKSSGLNVSSICQEALREALQRPLKSQECKHPVIIRNRCEICRETVEIRALTRRRKAS